MAVWQHHNIFACCSSLVGGIAAREIAYWFIGFVKQRLNLLADCTRNFCHEALKNGLGKIISNNGLNHLADSSAKILLLIVTLVTVTHCIYINSFLPHKQSSFTKKYTLRVKPLL